MNKRKPSKIQFHSRHTNFDISRRKQSNFPYSKLKKTQIPLLSRLIHSDSLVNRAAKAIFDANSTGPSNEAQHDHRVGLKGYEPNQ